MHQEFHTELLNMGKHDKVSGLHVEHPETRAKRANEAKLAVF